MFVSAYGGFVTGEYSVYLLYTCTPLASLFAAYGGFVIGGLSSHNQEREMNALIIALTMMVTGEPVTDDNVLDYDICHEGIRKQLPADALEAYAEICEER